MHPANSATSARADPDPWSLQCRLLSFEETNEEPLKVKTRVLVKLQLKLPWDPVLSWPWGVEHVYNPETGRIAEHIESWEIAPIDGVMQVHCHLSSAVCFPLPHPACLGSQRAPGREAETLPGGAKARRHALVAR